MLPFNNRLTKNRDFENVFQGGVGAGAGPVFLKFKKNNQSDSRFGISVGLSFSKKAVERNSAKRKISEIIRKNINYFKKGFDVIIIFRRPREKKEMSSSQLESFIKEAALKGNLINKS
jgi:ribonuclease P protein component